mgnify:FL=1
MKSKTQKITSLVFAVVAGFVDYLYLAFAKSMCYYSGDEVGMSPDLRETLRSACYEKYSTNRFLLEIVLVSLVVYTLSIIAFSFFKKK